jgi:hypothetical protein
MRDGGGTPARSEFRTPIGQRLLSLFGVLVLGGVCAAMAVAAAVALALQQWVLGALILAPVAAFMAGLTDYVLKDLRGKWGLRVALDSDALVLDLPVGRSLIHRPPAQHLHIPYDDIEAIESRLEAYETFGMAMLQRSYVLRRKNGQLIFLFEDRAIGSVLSNPVFAKLVADIVARAGVPLRDLGMAEGKGGFLAVWGAHAPDWAAPNLSLARQAQIWRKAAITGALAIVVVAVALILRLLSGPL